MYCVTIESWFFASDKTVNITAPSNGGKPVGLTLTYKKAIDVVANNADVLKICGKLAEVLAVPYNRVTDSYGGYFGNPSSSLPANTTRRMLATNTTTNGTNTTANATNATKK
jgi:hypothetical protein